MAGTIQDAPLVDTHAHIYHRGMPLSGSAWHTPPGDATIEDYLSTLDAAGVRFGVLAAASLYGDYNDYSLEAVRRHKRLRTTVIVHPETPMPILRKMGEDGVVGIRFQFRNVASPPDLRSAEYRRLLARVADLGWHVHLHDDGARVADFIAPLEAAGPRLVIDHFGRPPGALGVDAPGFQAVLQAVDRGRTWVKLSGAFRLEPPDAAVTFAARLIASAGPDRLLWGSDWPFAAFEDTVTYASVIEAYHRNVPDPQIRQAIDRTALSFYFS
jgi:predicted TIM-barrel fold metal-dependent hydrolase